MTSPVIRDLFLVVVCYLSQNPNRDSITEKLFIIPEILDNALASMASTRNKMNVFWAILGQNKRTVKKKLKINK